jgi:hypothetical protein
MSATPLPAAEPFDRLNAASVALLDPLLDAQLAERPRDLASRLADAIAYCAQTAEALGLRGLSYLATLMVPYLQRQAGGADWDSARERVETWIGDVVAFCAGQSDASDAAQLVLALEHWPQFPSVPQQFIALISSRLSQDADAIRAFAAAAGAEDTGRQPGPSDRLAGPDQGP